MHCAKSNLIIPMAEKKKKSASVLNGKQICIKEHYLSITDTLEIS